MYILPSTAPCDPLRLGSGARQSAIDGHAAFGDHERQSSQNPFVERFVKLRALLLQDAFLHCNPGVSQQDDASARMARIYVSRTNRHLAHPSPDYRIRARRSAALRRTRFQSHVQRSVTRDRRTIILQTFNLSVGATCSTMMSSRYDFVTNHQHGSHSWIGAGLAEAPFCLVQCSTHEALLTFCAHGRSIVVVAPRSNAR
jgi:hypothetical protein